MRHRISNETFNDSTAVMLTRFTVCAFILNLHTYTWLCYSCWDDTDNVGIWWIIKGPITASLLVSVLVPSVYHSVKRINNLFNLAELCAITYTDVYVSTRSTLSSLSTWSGFWSKSWNLPPWPGTVTQVISCESNKQHNRSIGREMDARDSK